MSIKTSFSFAENRWYRSWPESVSQHDVVYQSPPEDPLQGLPIGNGDLGALLWVENNCLMAVLNKSDLWDRQSEGVIENWDDAEEENQTCKRHCCKVIMDFNLPVFDRKYLKSFEARLGLAEGKAELYAQTPFSAVKLSAYVSKEHQCLVINCETDFDEPVKVNITVERWGSRNFAHWYSQVRREPEKGLDGTCVKLVGKAIVINQKLTGMEFSAAAALYGIQYEPVRLHQRAGRFETCKEKNADFSFYLTSATARGSSDTGASAVQALDGSMAAGEGVIYRRHLEEWENFWKKSFISISDNYIENIWYLVLYHMKSSSEGKYPPHFCNLLWGANSDFTPWNYYFHWNMQWLYWPVYAANHTELALPYLEYRYNQLQKACDFAKTKMHSEGAFYTDVSDANGYNDKNTVYNHTPGAQIAMDFWRHFLYTSDKGFLRNAAWPVIKAVAQYYSGFVVRTEDGRCHICGTQAYEGSPLFDDTVTDLSMIRALFPVALRTAEILGEQLPEMEKWKEILRNLVPFAMTELEENELYREKDRHVLAGGLGKGRVLDCLKVYGVGYEHKSGLPEAEGKEGPCGGKIIRNRHAGRKTTAYYGIPDPELAPVFPSGEVGLSMKESELFKAAVNQACIHPATLPDKDAGGSMSGDESGICMGWCPYPVVLARLGLSEYMEDALRQSISAWQLYCQGFGHYGPYSVFYGDHSKRWDTNQVTDVETREKFLLPRWPFRHSGSEAMSIAATAVNEMLLQSYDGILRIGPALPSGWEACFRLAAAGGFIVNAGITEGLVRWVCIESTAGSRCSLVNPWPGSDAFCFILGGDGGIRANGDIKARRTECDQILEFSTDRGDRYLLGKDPDILEHWTVVPEEYKKNTEFKSMGDAQLGLPRLY